MKHRFLLLVMLFSGLLAASSNSQLYYSENTDDRPKIEQTGSFSGSPSPGVKNNSGVPRGSSAGRLAVNDMSFSWKPSQISTKATGGADLISASLSDDETVLLIAERIGGTNKPNSTRLVLLNVRNNKIIRGMLLKERRISNAAFIPGSDKVLAVQQAQTEFNMPDALLVIDLKRNKITSHPAPGSIVSCCTDGEKAWYTVKENTFIYEAALDEMKEKPVLIRSLVTEPRLVLAPDNATVIVYGQNKLEKYKASSDKKLSLIQTFDTVGRFSPTQALVADDSGSLVLLVEPDKRAILYRDTIPAEFSAKPAGFQALFRKDNVLLYGLLKNNAIGVITLPDTEVEGRPVIPSKLKPINRNSTWKIFALTGTPQKALLIDIRGNVTMLEITKRRWKKIPVLTVDRTGM